MVGVAGSGKTTLAKKEYGGYGRVSPDDFRKLGFEQRHS